MKRWPTKPLGEICELVNGAPFKPSDWDGAGLPIIRIQNLNDSAKPFNYTSKILADKFRVRTGDTLLSWSGTPGTSFGCFRWNGPEGWLNQHIFNCYLRQDVLPRFFIHQVNSKLDELIGKAHGGVGLQHITKGALSSVIVTVPPLAEQERIVKLLDEADELRKIRAQADSRTAALVPALFHEFFGDETSENAKPLGEVCHKVTDGVHITPTYVTDGIPFLRVTDIQEEEISWNAVKRIPETEYNQITKRGKPEQGDVLYSKNGTIGIAKEITWERPFTHFVSLALLKPDRKILNPTFLTAWLNTPDALKQAIGRSKTGTVTNLHLNEIRKMRIPCPPMESQIAFVGQVTKIREFENTQAASRQRLESLFQSMLHRAFNGEI